MKRVLILALILLLSACGPFAAPDSDTSLSNPSAAAVLDRFQLVGLPVGPSRALSTEELKLFSAHPIEALEFQVAGLCDGCLGRVYLFSSVQDMETTLAHEQQTPSLGQGGFSWLFPNGKVLVLLEGRVPADWAEQYREALDSLAWRGD
ncbi:MAG: hypothetical protein AB1345_08990 [Chloroflexota bacterium]